MLPSERKELRQLKQELREKRMEVKKGQRAERREQSCWKSFDIDKLKRIGEELKQRGVDPSIYDDPFLFGSCLFCDLYFTCLQMKTFYLENKALKEKIRNLKAKS